jgi:thymidylate kinase
MSRIIIVEGPDGAGKTTLIDKIEERALEFGSVEIINHGAYLGESAIGHHYLKSIEMAASFNTVIMDRSWISEPIYGHVMRGGKNRLPWNDYRFLCNKANEFKAQIIYCLPPMETCLAAWRSRREIEYVDDEEKMTNVYQLYRASFSDMYIVPKRLWDWTQSVKMEEFINKEVFPQ